MKKFLFSLVLLIFISSFSYGLNDYKSIEEVKSLNYELFEEIGLDENKINYVSRVIYSTYKKHNIWHQAELLLKKQFHWIMKLMKCCLKFYPQLN